MSINTVIVTYNKNDGSQRVKKRGCKMTNNKTRAEKALATKKDTLTTKVCPACGQYVIRDGTQGRKVFCNNACRQSYHRWLNQHKAKIVHRPDPNRVAQQMVNAVYAHLADIETAL